MGLVTASASMSLDGYIAKQAMEIPTGNNDGTLHLSAQSAEYGDQL